MENNKQKPRTLRYRIGIKIGQDGTTFQSRWEDVNVDAQPEDWQPIETLSVIAKAVRDQINNETFLLKQKYDVISFSHEQYQNMMVTVTADTRPIANDNH
ncbi:MAG: hypothetical protein JHC38_09195 [Thiotrichales bacterium]|jgi:hypothetical protein|nr:hypothetical protein [Thiotrichales bacterium]